MRSLRKYFFVARARIEHQLEHRLAFFLERLRTILILTFLYAVWTTVSRARGSFAGFTHEELITYVCAAHFLRAAVFGTQTRKTAEEISAGRFSVYLTQPVNHFLFCFFREFGEQITLALFALFEIGIFLLVTGERIVLPQSWIIAMFAALGVVGANILYSILTYTVNLVAFWTWESNGPRFLFEWVIELFSGSYIPLRALGDALFSGFQLLPFFYLIYAPIHIYLGADTSEAIRILGVQFLWIVASGSLAVFVWKRGVKRYCGEGI